MQNKSLIYLCDKVATKFMTPGTRVVYVGNDSHFLKKGIEYTVSSLESNAPDIIFIKQSVYAFFATKIVG